MKHSNSTVPIQTNHVVRGRDSWNTIYTLKLLSETSKTSNLMNNRAKTPELLLSPKVKGLGNRTKTLSKSLRWSGNETTVWAYWNHKNVCRPWLWLSSQKCPRTRLTSLFSSSYENASKTSQTLYHRIRPRLWSSILREFKKNLIVQHLQHCTIQRPLLTNKFSSIVRRVGVFNAPLPQINHYNVHSRSSRQLPKTHDKH